MLTIGCAGEVCVCPLVPAMRGSPSGLLSAESGCGCWDDAGAVAADDEAVGVVDGLDAAGCWGSLETLSLGSMDWSGIGCLAGDAGKVSGG